MDEGKISNCLTNGPETYADSMGKRPNFHFCHDPSIRFCHGPQVTWYNTLSPEDDPSTWWTEWTLWGIEVACKTESANGNYVSVCDYGQSREVYGRSLAAIAGSIPACGTSISCECCLLSEFCETGRSLVQAGPTECLCVCLYH